MLGSPTRYFSLNRYAQTTPQRTERDGANRWASHVLQCGMKQKPLWIFVTSRFRPHGVWDSVTTHERVACPTFPGESEVAQRWMLVRVPTNAVKVCLFLWFCRAFRIKPSKSIVWVFERRVVCFKYFLFISTAIQTLNN